MDLMSLLITLIIAGVIFYLIIWVIDWIGIPDPFNKVIKVVLGLAVVLYLLGLLTGYAPHPFQFPGLRR